MNLSKRHTTTIVSLVLLSCLSIPLLWCSDTTCRGGQEGDCTCLICLLEKENTAESSNVPSQHTNSCSCLCQLLFLFELQSISSLPVDPEIFSSCALLHVLHRPAQRLFKPPKLRALLSYSFNDLFGEPHSEEDEQCLEHILFCQLC